jgi:hypothetical protein
MKNLKKIFITSSGRSGSKAIAQALNKINHVDSYHGPNVFEMENCLKYQKKMSSAQVKLMLGEKRDPLLAHSYNRNNHYVESSWFLSAILEEIIEKYPDALVVHLVRDGRDFVRSGMNRFWFKPGALSRYNAWTRDRWSPPSECRSRLEKISWLWAEQQRIQRLSMEKIPKKNNGGVIRLEDLISTPHINKFADQIGLPYTDDIILEKTNKSKNPYVIPHWKSWNDEYIDQTKRWLGDELREYDYEW